MATLVSVIIPNWNGVDILPVCLNSLERQNFKEFKVVVVDNGSKDGSTKFIKRNYPDIGLIELGKNYGFSYAANLAVEKVDTRYFALLNNDTEVDANWLANLVDTINSNPKIAAVASKMLNFKKRTLIDNAGDTINIVGQPHPRGRGQVDTKVMYKEGYIFGVTGGASIFRRDIFLKLGKFDQDFFFYFEDVDYALRAQLAGYKFYYQPKAIVYHHFAKSSAKFGKYIEYLRYRNTIYLVLKNFPITIFIKRKRFIKIPLVWLHTFYFFATHNLILQAIMVWAAVIWHLPSIVIKRLIIQRSRKASIVYLDQLMEDKKIKIFSFRF